MKNGVIILAVLLGLTGCGRPAEPADADIRDSEVYSAAESVTEAAEETTEVSSDDRTADDYIDMGLNVASGVLEAVGSNLSDAGAPSENSDGNMGLSIAGDVLTAAGENLTLQKDGETVETTTQTAPDGE